MNIQHNNAPAGTRQGVWDIDSGKVRFALWAPWKKSVSVVGKFNMWDTSASPLAIGEDSFWWCEIELEKGTYEYMFYIDDQTYIGDPYAREVHWRDKGPHSVIRVGEDPFNWEDENFHMPPLEELILYEIHIGSFSAEGTIQGVIDQLDYLTELGISGIELMPIFEFPGDFSWGYNPAYTMAVEGSYGTLSDFKILVNESHKRGIAVILDMVFNHVDHEHPFTKLYNSEDNPYFNDTENPWGFPNLNHKSDAVKGYIHQVQEYWLKDCHVDGFRYDATGNIGYDMKNGVSFMTHDAREIQSSAFLFAEHVPEDPVMIERTEMTSAWHKSWHHISNALLLCREFQGYPTGDMELLKQLLDPVSNRYQHYLQVINYTESHDWERVIHEVSKIPEFKGQELNRSVLGAALLLTAPGIPMFLFGQEIATNVSKETTLQPGNGPKWDDAFRDEGVKWLFECYKRLTWLRREQRALKSDKVEIWLADPESFLILYRRFAEGPDDEVLVMLNFSSQEVGFEVNLPRGGTYFEVLSAEDWRLETGKYTGTIPGSTARVLKRIGA